MNLIMKCVNSVSYFFRVNQSTIGTLFPERGLRQGDPLSPYLFALCAQGLSSILSKASQNRLFRGVRIATSSPVITHLFFADDSLLFFRATKEDSLQVRKCIQTYEQASGQMVNYEKSALSFSPNVDEQAIEDIKRVFSVEVVKGHDLYLGLPTFSLRSKKIQFSYLRERICQKIQGWSSKFFSMGGREVLIKSILQAIPSYAMSCFRIPVGLCNEIEQTCAKFWWSGKSGEKGLHWVRWDGLCKPKCAGGMGFRKLNAFNKALLAKQIWSIIHNPNSLMAKVLKAKYFRNHDIMEVKMGTQASYVWRSLMWSRELIRKGLCWRVGDGKSISIKTDAWIPGITGFRSKMCFNQNNTTKVESLITRSGEWDEDAVRQSFPIFEAEAILDIHLNNQGWKDIRFWPGSMKGIYTVKSGYALEMNFTLPPQFQSSHPNMDWWKLIWKLSLPPKLRIFIWRASKDLIPTDANLLSRYVPTTGLCPLCKSGIASTSHCLIFCPLVKNLWKNTVFWNHLKRMHYAKFLDCLLLLVKVLKVVELEKFVFMVWAIWKEFCILSHKTNMPLRSIDIDWVFSYIDAFKKVTEVGSMEQVSGHISAESGWVAPLPNHHRVDVDAGYDEARNSFSVAAVIRNHLGFVVGAKAQLIRHPGSVKGAELTAILYGLKYCLQLGFDIAQIYSDSSLAVNGVHQDLDDYSPNGIIIMEIQSLLSAHGSISLFHMRRNANEAAHQLARHALICSLFINWTQCNCPLWFTNTVTRDISS